MERQLLFLLDYDLRMEESELLIHFAPFLHTPVASTSSLKPRAIETRTTSPTSTSYPSTPTRRQATCDVGLLTPSPSPTRRTATLLPARRAPPSSQQRVSPSGSSSGGETMSDDLSSDEDTMDLDHSSHHRRRQPSPSVAKYVGAAPASNSNRRSWKTNSEPVTPTDELASYAVHVGYATPSSASNSPRNALRKERSGSFLQMAKGMLNVGNRSSKLLRDGVDLHDVRLI